ncbi:MAG: hypothetical protein ACRYHA_07530 [Janthinobacterium lividum]
MANLMLAFPNRINSAHLSGGQWQAPLTNLQDRRLTRVARSVDPIPDNTWFSVDLGQPRIVNAFALERHNLGLHATFRIRVAMDQQFQSVIYDSTTAAPDSTGAWNPAWPPLYSLGMLDWEAPNWWDRRLPAEERAGYPGLVLHVARRYVFGRYLRFDFSDPDNIDGYIEFGRLFVGQTWSPIFNATYGTSFGWEFDTVVDRAVGGALYFDERRGRRVRRFSLSWMSQDEAFGRAFEMQRLLGVKGEVMLIWDVDDTINMLRNSFIGRLRVANPIVQPHFAAFSQDYEIEELE